MQRTRMRLSIDDYDRYSKYRWVPLKPDFWEHENLSGLSVIWLIQLLLLKMNIQIKHCSTSKGSYWEDVFVCIIFQSLSPKPDIRPFKVIYFVSVMTVIRFWFMGSYLMTLHFL